MSGSAPQDAMARSMNDSSSARIALVADPFLELERETRPDRLDDRRRPALLAVLRVGEVDVLERVDVDDRPAARRRRDAVAEQLASSDEHARACPARR